jgi:hypothetical protein
MFQLPLDGRGHGQGKNAGSDYCSLASRLPAMKITQFLYHHRYVLFADDKGSG